MVTPKKHLGQHFLNDHNIAKKIVTAIQLNNTNNVVEVGPGTGILTKYLANIPDITLKVVEIDTEAAEFLLKQKIIDEKNLYRQDFLKHNLSEYFDNKMIITGNFPYNISSQIFFKILEHRNLVNQVVCMVQKEVAERLVSPPGNKTYGILSVLLQAYYSVKLLFTVSEKVFSPPPKVKSAVIHLERKENKKLNCSEALFFKIVKTGFNHRRKMLGNSLKELLHEAPKDDIFLKRPEQLRVEEFVYLTSLIENFGKT